MKLKKLGAVLLACAMCCGLALPLAGCGSSGPNQFEWWLASQHLMSFYTDYDDNPVVRYIEDYKTFENQDGEQQAIDFDYMSPTSQGAETDFATLISTGDFPELMDLSVYTGSSVDLYKQGIAMDITDYVEQYMPNYMAWLNEPGHEYYKSLVYQDIDGEKRIVRLISFNDEVNHEQVYCGYLYRRDWLLKYGSQPQYIYEYEEIDYEKGVSTDPDVVYENGRIVDGQATLKLDSNGDPVTRLNPNYVAGTDNYFSGSYTLKPDKVTELSEAEKAATFDSATRTPIYDETKVSGDSWVDNVVFPSGYSDPVYLSDWEWMLGIFQTAIEDLEGKVSGYDGYAMNLQYQGYHPAGDLVSSFGGGNSSWYLKTNEDGTREAEFGGNTEGFRVYLETMNKWWKNNWIDPDFDTRSTDLFYRIDESSVYSGEVGLWYGSTQTLDSRIYNSQNATEATRGIVVYGASQPINDLYGSDDLKFNEPYTFYQQTLENTQLMITTAAEGKDLVLLFHFLDYMCSPEGSLLRSAGLNKEQVEECNSEFYHEYGMDDGAYTVEFNADGTIDKSTFRFCDVMENDIGGISSVAPAGKLWGMQYVLPRQRTETNRHSMEQYMRYENTGFVSQGLIGQMTVDEANAYSETYRQIETEFMARYVSQIIKGNSSTYSYTGQGWQNFVDDLSIRNPDRVTQIFQRLLNEMNTLQSATASAASLCTIIK